MAGKFLEFWWFLRTLNFQFCQQKGLKFTSFAFFQNKNELNFTVFNAFQHKNGSDFIVFACTTQNLLQKAIF
jgi:hypothetical protein